VQEQLEQLAGSIMQGLEKAADERIMQAGGALRDLQPAGASGGQQRHPQWEQQAQALVQQVTATPGGGAGTPSLSSGLQDALLSCKLLCGFQLHDDVRAAAVQLLQQQPGTLWGAAAGLASGTLADVTGLLDAAEGEMMAPQVWPLAAASEGGDEDAAAKTGDGSHGGNDTSRPQQPDQQQRQLAAAGPPSGSAKRRLPWASGVSSAIAAAYAARSIPPPPEVRVRMRQLQHMQLFVAAREAEQRCARARQELAMVLGSTPLLQGMLAHAGAGGAAAPLMLTGSNDGGGSGDTSSGASSWEAAAAALHLRAAALQGRLSALRRIEGEQRREADMLLEAEEAYNEKLAKVEEKVRGVGRCHQHTVSAACTWAARGVHAAHMTDGPLPLQTHTNTLTHTRAHKHHTPHTTHHTSCVAPRRRWRTSSSTWCWCTCRTMCTSCSARWQHSSSRWATCCSICWCPAAARPPLRPRAAWPRCRQR
jgi:hypothetical protein